MTQRYLLLCRNSWHCAYGAVIACWIALRCTETLCFAGLCQRRAGWPTQSADKGTSSSEAATFQQNLF